jgi:predicted transcriptional regulator
MEHRSTYPANEALSGLTERAGVRAEASNIQLPVLRGLGQREREVMAVLWTQGDANVQQVSSRLSANLAYTSVMTTLDRLFKKGLLRREKRDRAFIYSTALTSREVEGQRAADLIRRFFSDSGERPELLLSCLVDAVEGYDTALLDQLESRIQAARARQLASATGAADANPDREHGGGS